MTAMGVDAISVLVVDDDLEIRDALRFVLEEAGYTVAEAVGGAAALDALRASADPMVVLLDRIMPAPDGESVLWTVAQEGLGARHVYVLVTAGPTRFAQPFVELLDTLDTPVVQKPFDLDELLEIVVHASQRLPRGN
jgi:CheY-like chemotaxis protein